MPTDANGNGSSPTSNNANAQVDVTSLTPEQLEANPHFADLKTKYSAARTGMDDANVSKKDLKAEIARLRVLAGEEITPEKEDDSSKPITKADLQKQVWELSNAKDIDLYGDEEYKNDVDSGIPKEYALKTAQLRFQSNPDKVRLERQQFMASGSSASTRNVSSIDMEGYNPEEAKKWGYSKETWIKQREMKKARGQQV